jgi:two-component system phosphate regulon response regulator PhoB
MCSLDKFFVKIAGARPLRNAISKKTLSDCNTFVTILCYKQSLVLNPDAAIVINGQERNMKKVLIIEDEKDLAELLAFNLEKEGYAAICVHDGKLGMERAVAELPDLILLDLMLPGMLGTDVCKVLRKDPRTTQIPIIMITAKGDEIDRVVGFEVGADDYIVKPFSMREVALRVKAVMRRFEHEAKLSTTNSLTIGDIVIDKLRHTVMSAGLEIDLTSTEYKLLLYLAEKKECVQSREQLLQKVWSYNNSGDTRTVDTHVTRLRGKLGAPGDIIRTVRGFGYKIEE